MSAKTLATNSNNDIYLGADGNIALAFDLNAVAQTCNHAAEAQRGEMVLNVNDGIPNFQLIWVGVPNLQQFETAVRAALLAVTGVTEVISFTSTVTNNVLDYNATIRTIYGVGQING